MLGRWNRADLAAQALRAGTAQRRHRHRRLLRRPALTLAARHEREHQRPAARVLTQGHRPLPLDPGRPPRRPRRGQQQTPQGPRLEDPGRGPRQAPALAAPGRCCDDRLRPVSTPCCIHRAPRAEEHRPLDRIGRGRLRQRPHEVDNRAMQGRVHPPRTLPPMSYKDDLRDTPPSTTYHRLSLKQSTTLALPGPNRSATHMWPAEKPWRFTTETAAFRPVRVAERSARR